MCIMIAGFVMLYINIMLLRGMNSKKNARVENLILTSIIWCLYLYFVTEILSINNKINAASILIAWVIFLVVTTTIAITFFLKKRHYILKNVRIHISKIEIGTGIIFLAYSALVIYLATHTVPYNSDSMVYHLTRIFRWARNGSISHYATNNWRAIASTPFTEFVGLHIYLLENNDNLINLIQAFSFCGVIYMVYQIAELIGCDQRAKRLSALLFATLPIAFAESRTTQVDDFAALWLVFFIYMLVEILKDDVLIDGKNHCKLHMIFLGLILGFGYLTKPTLLPAAGIFTLWVIIVLLRRGAGIRQILMMGFIAIISLLVLISPEILRNLITFNAISYHGVGARQIVGTLRPNYILVNYLKVVFTNLPSIYWPNVYWRFPAIVYRIGAMLGVNVDDPSIAETGIPYTVAHAPDYGCDTAVNFVIAILVIIFLGIQITKWIFEKKKKISWGYSSCAFLAFIVLQFIVRWEPYLNRYMIGYMALLAPAIGMQLQKMQAESQNGKYLRGVVTGMIIFVSFVEGMNMADNARLAVMTNKTVNHTAQYFATGKDKYEDYEKLAKSLSEKVKNGAGGDTKVNIGLNLMEGSLEYPLLRMIDQSASEIKDINVNNVSVKYEDISYIPKYIIYMGKLDKKVICNGYQCHGISYKTFERISDTCYLIAQ